MWCLWIHSSGITVMNEYCPQTIIAIFCFSFTGVSLTSTCKWHALILCHYLLMNVLPLCWTLSFYSFVLLKDFIFIWLCVFVSSLIVWGMQQSIFPSGELKDPPTQPHGREALHMPTSWLFESLQQFQRSGQTPAYTLGYCMYGHSLCPSG